MRVHILSCCGAWVALFAFLSVAAPAQNPALQQSAARGSTTAADYNDATYRKFDQTLSFLRERNARQYAIDPAKGVDEASYVSIGGIEQWVTIRGEDRSNPVLLFLHGGPGDVTNPWSFATVAPWEAHFTVVQWDQRGAGRSEEHTSELQSLRQLGCRLLLETNIAFAVMTVVTLTVTSIELQQSEAAIISIGKADFTVSQKVFF